MVGPLAGVRVVELAGIGPAPFAAMMLADMGAEVIRVDRLGGRSSSFLMSDVSRRGRRSIGIDVKINAGRDLVLRLVDSADVFLEGFRPGVTERLGLGPAECLERRPQLIYARMTGWGQDGPLAHSAGHDLVYIALTGALHASRRTGALPVPPLNLLGDGGGGATYLAFGVVCALMEARASGKGQIVDASILDGTASLTNLIRGLLASGRWGGPPGANLLDTGAPFYEIYACADGKEIAIAALEPQFYEQLLRLSGIVFEPGDEISPEKRDEPAGWRTAKLRWSALFSTRPRHEWCEIFYGSDACFAPVLTFEEAIDHPQIAARGTLVSRGGVVQAAPAPRFSRTVPTLERPPGRAGEHTDEILEELGLSLIEATFLRDIGAIL